MAKCAFVRLDPRRSHSVAEHVHAELVQDAVGGALDRGLGELLDRGRVIEYGWC